MSYSRAHFCRQLGLTLAASVAVTLAGAVMLPRAAHADPGPAPASSAGAAGRQHFDALRSVVVGRTAQSTSYLNPDGTRTAVLSGEPVNYRTSDGSFQPINDQLVSDSVVAGGLTNTANAWRVHFGATHQGVSLVTAKGALGMAPQGAASVQPVRGGDGSQVTYPNAWPNADLRYDVTATGVKESVLLKSATAGSSFSFDVWSGSQQQVLTHVGANHAPALRRDSNGAVTPVGAMSDTTFGVPMVLRADGEPMERAHAKLTSSAGKLVLSVDPAWLAAQPASAFPINLDPTIFVAPDKSYSYKSDGYSCQNCGVQFGNSRDGGDTDWRTVAHFPYESLFGQELISASLQVGWQSGTANAYNIKAYWASSYSYYGTTGHPTVLASGAPGTTAGAGLTGAPLLPQLKSWTDNHVPGAAFGFVGTETAGLYTYQKYDVKLYVSYVQPPTQSTNVIFSVASPSAPSCLANGAIDGSKPMSWKVTVHAPTTRYMVAQFLYWDNASPTKTAMATSGQFISTSTDASAWQVSFKPNRFIDGHSYSWKAQGSDGVKTSPWNSTCKFHVVNPSGLPATNLGFGASTPPAISCGSVVRGDQNIVLDANIHNSTPTTDSVRAVWNSSYKDSAGTTHTMATAYSNWSTGVASIYQQDTIAPNTGTATYTIPNNTDFSWTVAVQLKSTMKSSTANACDGTTSSGQLPAPVITGDDELVGGSANAGDPNSNTLTFTDSSSAVTSYVYSFNNVLPDISDLNCGDVADVTTGNISGLMCSGTAPSGDTDISWNAPPLTVPSELFSITAWAIDATGTVSPSTTVTFTAVDPSALPGHLWLTDGSMGAPTAPQVADVLDPSNQVPLTLTSNTSGPSYTTTNDGAPWQISSGSQGSAFTFDGSQGEADTGPSGSPGVQLNTADGNWDVTDNFSVQAWVRPGGASGTWSGTGWHVAMGQDGQSVSGFILGVRDNQWVYCMPDTQYADGGGFDGDCATSSVPVTAHQWVLLTGVWDATAGKLMLYVSTTLNDWHLPAPDLTTVAHPDSPPADGALSVGRGEFSGVNGGYWSGDIEDPNTWSGVMNSDQVASIAANGPYNGN